jgi:hypothetical protein
MSGNERILGAALAVAAVIGGISLIRDRDDSSSRLVASAEADAANSVPEGAAVAAGPSTTITDFVDGDTDAPPPTNALVAPTASCTITEPLEEGSVGDQVVCLHSQLAALGYQATGETFDANTDQVVRAFQTAKSVDVDGIVGPQTAQLLGIWAGGSGPFPARDSHCPDSSHAAVVDRANQQGWLCLDGKLTDSFPLTSAWSQPDPGTYDVYAKDLNASSNLSGEYSTMTHFVAFTKGKYKGARIAFHSVPKYANGEYVQPLDSVGTPEQHGASAGCIRVLPDDAVMIWDYLAVGDQVRVIS